METYNVSTPVALFVFNRPDVTQKVFSQIAKVKPSTLFVVADGPREAVSGEAELCRRTRSVIDSVDWDCEILTDFSDRNMGCRRRLVSGLDWVFETVPEAIILEDDCCPNLSFFRFCDEMIEKYRDDERIGMVSGDNFQFDKTSQAESYYFSRYAHIWGWASWRRAWRHFDEKASVWPDFKRRGGFESLGLCKAEQRFWSEAFQSAYEKDIDIWDYQWMLALWAQNMLTVMPGRNLVSNIGFGQAATHTKGESIFAEMETCEMEFPLRHPDHVFSNVVADEATSKMMFRKSLHLWIREKFL